MLTSSHGLDGTIKALFYSGDSSHIKVGDILKVITVQGKELNLTVDRINHSSSPVYIHFVEYNTKEDVKALANAKVYIPRSKAHPLEEGEVYTQDLIGLDVTFKGSKVGVTKSVMEGSQSVLIEVEREDKKKYLVPYLGVFVGDVNLEAGTLELLNGELLEL